jgi:hypothetical protein
MTAGGGALLRTVRLPVDHHPAGTADPLAAVVLELDRLLAVHDEPVVDDVEHLEERHLGADVGDVVGLERTGRGRRRLTPHLQGDVHYL